MDTVKNPYNAKGMNHNALSSSKNKQIKKKLNSIDSAKLHNPNELKQHLIREMLELDKQKQALEAGSHVDFSMLQTYKEMHLVQ